MFFRNHWPDIADRERAGIAGDASSGAGRSGCSECNFAKTDVLGTIQPGKDRPQVLMLAARASVGPEQWPKSRSFRANSDERRKCLLRIAAADTGKPTKVSCPGRASHRSRPLSQALLGQRPTVSIHEVFWTLMNDRPFLPACKCDACRLKFVRKEI